MSHQPVVLIPARRRTRALPWVPRVVAGIASLGHADARSAIPAAGNSAAVQADVQPDDTRSPTAAFLAWADAAVIPEADRRALWRLHLTWQRAGLDESERLRELEVEHSHWTLWHRVLDGDAACAAAFERYWRGYVRAYCSGRFDKDEADELCSRLLSRMVERLDGRFQWQCTFTAYVRAMLVNLGRDLVRERARRRERETPIEAASGVASAAQSPDAGMIDDQTRAAVRAALRLLAPGDRHVLVQHVVAGRPATEVAVEMGLTVNALYQRLHRARERLRNVLVKEGLASRGDRT